MIQMIKMVIFCVIAYALAWLPFNLVIIIGDFYPTIYERANMGHIYMFCHFLSMCHTITNPVIYIWMNNRFRSGFKEVFMMLGSGLTRCLAYLVCYLCLLSCILPNSRARYRELIKRRDRAKANKYSCCNDNHLVPCPNNNNHQNHNHGRAASVRRFSERIMGPKSPLETHHHNNTISADNCPDKCAPKSSLGVNQHNPGQCSGFQDKTTTTTVAAGTTASITTRAPPNEIGPHVTNNTKEHQRTMQSDPSPSRRGEQSDVARDGDSQSKSKIIGQDRLG